MIEMMSTLARGVCRNCGEGIVQLVGDLALNPVWFHETASEGRYREHCLGSPVAEPRD